ncbi:MAG: VCBS repeat-containing protein [Planctomycetaceae bacterium]|nr:VCBS repeat-containing protein [Planctomycetaceae bacterium]
MHPDHAATVSRRRIAAAVCTLAISAIASANGVTQLTYASSSTVVNGVRYFHTDIFAEYATECERALLVWDMDSTMINAGPLWHRSYPDTPATMKPLAYDGSDPLFAYDSFICIGGREQVDISGLYWLTPDFQDGLVTGTGSDIGGVFLVPPIGQWSFAGPDRKVRVARFTLHESNWNPDAAIWFSFRMASGEAAPGNPTFDTLQITAPFTLLPESTTATPVDEPSPEPYCWQESSGGGGGGGGGGSGGPPGGIPNPDPADFDFDLDGKSDLMWHLPAGGNTARWLMDGIVRKGGGAFPWSTFGGFQVLGTGDQNDDGMPEVVFWHPQGRWVILWSIVGSQRIANPFIGDWSATSWTPIAVGDYTGDGRIDLLERFGGIYYRVTPLANYRTFAAGPSFTLPAGHTYVTTADVTGDGIAELILRDGVNRYHAMVSVYGAGGVLISMNPAPVPADWRLAGTGDLDGDHDDDLVWHNPTNGEVRGWLMQGGMRVEGAVIRTGVAPQFELVSACDTDGDGDDDLFWRDISSGNVFGWRMDGLVRVEGGFVRNVSPAWKVVNR